MGCLQQALGRGAVGQHLRAQIGLNAFFDFKTVFMLHFLRQQWRRNIDADADFRQRHHLPQRADQADVGKGNRFGAAAVMGSMSLRLLRSINTVPALRTAAPISGQPASSFIAIKLDG